MRIRETRCPVVASAMVQPSAGIGSAPVARACERAEQAVGAHLRNPHRCDVSDHCLGSHDLNCLQIWGAAGDLARMASRLVEQNIEGAAETLPIEGSLLAVDCGLQTVEPLGFHLVGVLTVHVRGRRAGPRRVFERKSAGVPNLVDQRERRAKIILAFAREADDEIRGERDIRACVAHARDGIEIVRPAVTAVHRRQNAVGTRLHRKVQVRHQPRQIAMRRDQARVHVARMARGVAQASDSRHLGNARQQTPQRPGTAVGSFAVIGVHVLPDQRDLAHAGIREPRDFGNDLRDRSRRLGAARIGHDTERAELVAAFLHGDECRDTARADRVAARGLRRSNLSSTGNSVSTTAPSRSARASRPGSR